MAHGQSGRSKEEFNHGKLPTTTLDSYNALLFDAIREEKPRIVRRLLASNLNPNMQGERNETPLFVACNIRNDRARKKIVELLLRKGADVNQQSISGRSPVMNAILIDAIDTVSTLIDNNCHINLVDCDGNNALCYAAMLGNTDIVRRLVQESSRRKLEIDHQNLRGLTALLIASQKGHIETAKILVMEGAASTTIRDLENFMNAHEWMKVTGTYTTKELAFLLPSRKRRNYRQEQQNKGIRTFNDYVPLREHEEDCESTNVFTVQSKSLDDSNFVLPTLIDLQPTQSVSSTAFGPNSESVYNLPKRSMFDIPAYSTCSSASSRKLQVHKRTASISTTKKDVYHSIYLDRRKSLLGKSDKYECYRELQPIGFDPNEKISKLATIRGSKSICDKQKHNSLPPLQR